VRPGGRRQARERAIQVLFQWDIHGAAGYWLEDFWTQHPSPPEEREFAERIIEGVRTHREELDRLIGAHATNWKVSRMPIVDRCILRAALCELLWMPDVPAKVTVNEALELAKVFADDETRRFVNGILDQVLKSDPRLETKRAGLAAEAGLGALGNG
jgi:N utilization substance protein B